MALLARAARGRGAPLPPVAPADEVAQCRLGDACLRRCASSRPDDGAVRLAGPERLGLLERLLPSPRSLRARPIPPVGCGRPSRARGAPARRRPPGLRAQPGALSGLRAREASLRPRVGRRRGRRGGRGRLARRARDRHRRRRGASQGRARPCRRRSARSEPPAGPATTSRPAPTSTAMLYDRAVLEGMHPRLLGVRQLVDEGAVRPTTTRGRERDERRGRVPRPLRGRRHALHVRVVREAPGERGPCSTSSRPSTRAGS